METHVASPNTVATRTNRPMPYNWLFVAELAAPIWQTAAIGAIGAGLAAFFVGITLVFVLAAAVAVIGAVVQVVASVVGNWRIRQWRAQGNQA